MFDFNLFVLECLLFNVSTLPASVSQKFLLESDEENKYYHLKKVKRTQYALPTAFVSI